MPKRGLCRPKRPDSDTASQKRCPRAYGPHRASQALPELRSRASRTPRLASAAVFPFSHSHGDLVTMFVEFQQRWRVYRAMQRIDCEAVGMGSGVAKELIKRKICKEVASLRKRGRPKKNA